MTSVHKVSRPPFTLEQVLAIPDVLDKTRYLFSIDNGFKTDKERLNFSIKIHQVRWDVDTDLNFGNVVFSVYETEDASSLTAIESMVGRDLEISLTVFKNNGEIAFTRTMARKLQISSHELVLYTSQSEAMSWEVYLS